MVNVGQRLSIDQLEVGMKVRLVGTDCCLHFAGDGVVEHLHGYGDVDEWEMDEVTINGIRFGGHALEFLELVE